MRFPSANPPNIKVNIQTVGYGEYFVRLMTSVVAGTAPPDAFELNFENFAAYAMKGGTILPLEELIENRALILRLQIQMHLQPSQVIGNNYGLPFSFSNVNCVV